MATMVPATDFDTTGMATRLEVTQWFNQQVVVGLMIEDESAVDDIEKIVAIPGLDVIQIGATDLAASMGHMGVTSHPTVVAAIERVRAACLGTNLTLAMTVGHPSYPLGHDELVAQGYRMLICGIDMGIVMAGLKQTATRIIPDRQGRQLARSP
jgi:2-keto-3-deoxy-L-rhamnonate aldolase RhmA